MAEIYRSDIVRVDLDHALLRKHVGAILVTGDKLGNRFGAEIFRDGNPVDVTGSGVTAYFMRPGEDAIVLNGTASGSVAYVDLAQACYSKASSFTLTIKISYGGATTALRVIDGYILLTQTDDLVDPGEVVPTLDDIFAQIAAMEAATERAQAATADAIAAKDNANGAAVYAVNIATEKGDQAIQLAQEEADKQNEKIATLTQEKQDIQTGKNIFDKNSRNQISGYYFMFSDGTRQPADGYSATVVKVKGGEMLSFNTHNLHVCALSSIPDLNYYSNNYGVLDGYLEGFADALPKQGYIVPDAAVCLVVSCKTEELSTLQIENGDHSTTYESYVTGIRPSTIIDGVDSKTLIVGVGWYESITDAFKAAKDGDTIFVMPGTYTETVNARSKNVKIKGFSRDACILTYPSSDYFYPPLEMAKGVVEDMTIIATGTELGAGATMMAYCVHVDWNEQEGTSLQFRNCRFVNEIRNCVGIGTRRNSRLSFVGCEFECGTDACVFLHEDQANDSIQQYVEFIDCSMKVNYAGPAIRMQETPDLTNNLATVRFQRNILTNLGGDTVVMQQYGTQPGLNGNGFLGATNWSLDNASALNSDTVIDAQ